MTRALQLTAVGNTTSSREKNTAILLVGLMRGWDQNHWHKRVRKNIVKPHNADIFVHATEMRDEFADMRSFFGDSIKAILDEGQPGVPPQSAADFQFWHLQEAWALMVKYENNMNMKYDVVIKLRTDIAPCRSAYLSLAGWEIPGRIHMLSDMIFWGQRDDMEKITHFYDNITPYYKQKYADPFSRPIDVHAMLESIKRDPITNKKNFDPTKNNVVEGIDWHLYNKIETVPYPDMGKLGALKNLKAAAQEGITICRDNHQCRVRCGDQYYNERLGPRSCDGGGDYAHGEIRCEKDILHWVMANGLIVCDVGASMHTIWWKLGKEVRDMARDCD